jgi:hypothetical protein
MFLWNAKIGEDYCVAKLACQNTSTVDYFLSSSYVFENVVIKVKSCDIVNTTVLRKRLTPKRILWACKKAELFAEDIDIFKMSELEMKRDQLNENDIV